MQPLIWIFVILQMIYCIDGKLGFRDCGKVFVTVSSLRENKVEMNWVTNCNKTDDVKPDFITLHKTTVTEEGDNEELLKLNATDFPGYHQTEISFGELELPAELKYDEGKESLPSGKHCFRFWIASWSNGQLLDVDCFSANPTWMNDISDKIKDKRIGEIMIPGTHNSASYLGKGKIFHVTNQEVCIWQQLVYGIRFLDIRMQRFRLNFDIIPLDYLQPLLDQLKSFLKISPKEVVVLNFPIPPRSNIYAHKKLLKTIYDSMADYILWPNLKSKTKGGPTLQEIWDYKKNLIVSYAQKDIVDEYPWLWDPLLEYSSVTSKPDELHAYLESMNVDERPIGENPMWAAMAELMPNTLNTILNADTMRKYADQVNRHVTSWYRNGWWKSANIVATDFFFGNDIINVAIEANKET